MSETNPPGSPVHNQIVTIQIEDEMRGAYLDYAMSVIIGRALPDVRDGLKPVHRRTLFAMYDLGNTRDKPYKKSARVVGDVIGKYHPHGDFAVYDTIVRMAQDFSLRYPLVDGQGNFGSVDGDSAAAMRYTEVRMESITNELLADLEKDTVDFTPNYDESLKEPVVFPAKFPNLLVNGSTGIAVGMATNIPPHNLTEVIDATLALIEDPKLTTLHLLQHLKGPDFPTGGILFGGSGLKQAYLTGKGIVTIRGKAEIITLKKDREAIIVHELPYQVNKARLIEKIAELVKDKRISGISDLRDESDREGMRIVIEVSKGENSNVLLNQLYKMTQLQESFGISLLAIHNQQPKVFNLKDMIWSFVDHRREVVMRRTAFDLSKAKARAHILEGLKRAVENLDAVIALIRGARGPVEAKTGLIEGFQFSSEQAQAILDMRLQRLTGLERDKIIQDYQEVLKLIESLKLILSSEKLVFEIISNELKDIRQRFGDKRRTEIALEEASDFEDEDLIADEETLVTITHRGYIKRQELSLFRRQGRGGKGVIGVTTSDDDFVSAIYLTTTLSYLLCFTNEGRVHWLKVFRVPDASRASKGKAIVNLLTLGTNERVIEILPVKDFSEDRFVVMATESGVIKKTSLSEFKNVRTAGIIALSVDPGDQLVGAAQSNGSDDVFLSTCGGQCIRFQEDNVRAMGRTARGVAGMNLDSGDKVVSLAILKKDSGDAEILTVTEGGYGKRTPVSEYRQQSRGGKGIRSMNITDKNGPVFASIQVRPSDEVMMMSDGGKMIRISVGGISEQGRVTQGVRLMSVGEGEKVVALEQIQEPSSDGIPPADGNA